MDTIDLEPVRSFIRRKFLFDGDAPLENEQQLVPGVIDSLGVMDLADFIEETYGIEVAEDELLVDNFRNLEAIGSFVLSKK